MVVTIDGIPRPVEDVRLVHEIPSEMSEADFTGGGGVFDAEAQVTWAPSGPGLGVDHPWSPTWGRNPGSVVLVEADGVRVFTGVVLSSAADFGSGSVVTRCLGRSVELDREVSVPPVAFTMPPPSPGGSIIRAGMSGSWATQHVLGQCGFWSHAPVQTEATIAMSMVGSLWPSVGTLTDGWSNSRSPAGRWSPHARQTLWGGGACVDPYAVVEAALAPSGTVPITLVVDLGDSRSGDDGYITYRGGTTGASAGMEIRVTPTLLRLYTVDTSGSRTLRLTAPRTAQTTRVQATRIASTTNSLTLRTDTGYVGTWDGSTGMSQNSGVLTVDISQGDIGAIQVFRADRDLTGVPRTARIRRDLYDQAINGGVGSLDYYKGQAINYLAEQSRAERVPMWVDEAGVMQVCDRRYLDEAPPARVLTVIGCDTDFLSLPGNLFADPYPTGDGWDTTGLGTTTAYEGMGMSRWARVTPPQTGARAAWQDGIETVIDTHPSMQSVTVSAQVRHWDVGQAVGGIRAQGLSATGAVLTSAEGVAGGLTHGAWVPVTATLDLPTGVVQVRVRAANAVSSPNGYPDRTWDWRGFTTLPAPAIMESLTATVSARLRYGRVVVKGQGGTIDVRTQSRILLANGQRQTLDTGDDITTFFHPEPGVTWLSGGVDVDPQLWHGVNTPGAWRRRGSVYGGYRQNISTEAIQGLTEEMFDADMELLDPHTVLYTGHVDLPSGWEMHTIPNPNDTATSRWNRGSDPLPEVRGRGVVRWRDEETIVDLPTAGVDLVIEGGQWLMSANQRIDVANQAAARLANPQPILTGLTCSYAPVRCGERVTIRVSHITDLTIDGVVQAVTHNPSEGSMDLQVRVLGATAPATFGRWQDQERFANRDTYGQVQDHHGGSTYGQVQEAAQ